MRKLSWLAPATLAFAILPLPGMAAPGALSAQAVGRPAAGVKVPFLVHVPLRNAAELEQLVTLESTPGSLVYHHWLTPAQFAARYGMTAAQRTVALNALHAAGVGVDRVSAQFITAHAPVATVERTFGAQMATFRAPGGRLHLGSRVALTLPAALRGLSADVEGLVYHGEGQPTHRIWPAAKRAAGLLPDNRYGPNGPLWFTDIKQAYDYPAYRTANGKGVSVATVNESDFNDADLKQYLNAEKIGSGSGFLAPLPSVFHVLVPGAQPWTADPHSPFYGTSVEADLDTQQVAGTAPGASLTGWTTNAFDFPADFLQVYDSINSFNSADIVSTSYGECELLFTAGYNGGQSFEGILRALHEVFLQGNSQGITYTVSSGDEAGRPCPELGYFLNLGAHNTYSTVPSVDIPASDPNVVAVGGGNLLTTHDNTLNSSYVRENANADPETSGDVYGTGNTLTNIYWGAGGGISVVFPQPSWQKGITPGAGRAVPDVGLFVGGCFSGDPQFVQPCSTDVSHAVLTFDGGSYDVIGTSVAAPEFAGLLATIEDKEGSGRIPGSGRMGNVNPRLYSLPSYLFHKNIPGNNGVYTFAGGARWNPSYGLGSLFGYAVYGAAAGIPQTPSNP